MNGRLIHTEILRADDGAPHLMGVYLTADCTVYMRDLGPIL